MVTHYATRGIDQIAKPAIHITYCFDTNRRRDKDNYTPKFILDGLVKAGVIKDDNTDEIELNWELKTDNKRVTIISIKARG